MYKIIIKRFCIINNKDTFGRIFSAHWDPNNSDRMYLCSQDGRMKSLKIETNESKIYKILFRRFRTGSLADVEPSREINTHFDKICFQLTVIISLLWCLIVDISILKKVNKRWFKKMRIIITLAAILPLLYNLFINKINKI